jgi:hypothetical protein
MRRFLIAGARAPALFSAVLWLSAQGAGPARALGLRELDGRVAELEQTLVDTEVKRSGLGIERAINSANLLLHTQAHSCDPTLVGHPCIFVPDPKVPGTMACGGDPSQAAKPSAAPRQGFAVGARIQF